MMVIEVNRHKKAINKEKEKGREWISAMVVEYLFRQRTELVLRKLSKYGILNKSKTGY
jgi:hypothetical protein